MWHRRPWPHCRRTQWCRSPQPAASALELGTLLLRYGINTTNLLDTQHGSNPNGVVGIQGGNTAVLQHRNKMVVLTSPYYQLQGAEGVPRGDIHSLQTTIGLLTLQEKPSWTVYVDGRPLTTLPARVKMTSRIAIQDGVSYLGLIPIPATNLGRDEEIVIKDDGTPVAMQGGGTLKPALIIEEYNYKRETPLNTATADWDAIDRAYGGFIIEMADNTEYRQFADFQRHLRQDRLKLHWEESTETLALALKSGNDLLELGYRPRQHDGPDDKIPARQYFPYRRVNGQWPYLAAGIERDTTLSIQGRTGHLEKNGAVLTCEPGMMGYLLTEPKSGTYAGYNPLPDATYWSMTLPGNIRVDADGKVGMLSVVAQPMANKLAVDYAVTEQQNTADMASALLVSGMYGTPAVVLNGKPLPTPLDTIELEGRRTLVIPLTDAYPGVAQIAARYHDSLAAQQTAMNHSTTLDAKLRYEPKQEHYLLTVPRSGAYRFQRLWPSPSVIDARVPGMRVATDGRVALLRLDMSRQDHLVDAYLPPYAQNFDDRAKALLIFGVDAAPTLIVNGERYAGTIAETQLNGEKVYVAPLFGNTLDAVLNDLPARYQQAQLLLGE